MIEYEEILSDTGEIIKKFIVRKTDEYDIHTYQWGFMFKFGDKVIVISDDVVKQFSKYLKSGKDFRVKSYIKENNLPLWILNGWRLFGVKSEIELI